ncbi:hypothetical protein BHM03_00035201 [Ensete ventricosum]|nr:hypothetical protein BHM03_00035201 [Ensete ventricosum]
MTTALSWPAYGRRARNWSPLLATDLAACGCPLWPGSLAKVASRPYKGPGCEWLPLPAVLVVGSHPCQRLWPNAPL